VDKRRSSITYKEENGEQEYWDGETMRSTGRLVVVMVGDDYRHIADPEDCALLPDEDYCAVCVQIGCTQDGRDREAV